MSAPRRVYSEKGAPRCPRCHGPMVEALGMSIHPTCSADFRRLLNRSGRAGARRAVTRG